MRRRQTRFGSINGFRMGTLPQERVGWNEINAGWGQAALLLATLAKRCSYSFTSYEVVPKVKPPSVSIPLFNPRHCF